MTEHISRGHITFDAQCPKEFKELVEQTLETSDFISVEPTAKTVAVISEVQDDE